MNKANEIKSRDLPPGLSRRGPAGYSDDEISLGHSRRKHLAGKRLAEITPGHDSPGTSRRDVTNRDISPGLDQQNIRWERRRRNNSIIGLTFGSHREGATAEGQRPT